MLTRFFTPSELTDFFEQGQLKQDLFDGETIAICSVADLLDICEAYKKGNLRISHQELDKRFDAFNENPEGPVRKGVIHISEMDQDNLSSALFERDDGTVTDLWCQAANKNISPKRSVRYLTLRMTSDSIWWSEDVYQQMEDYHMAQEE